MTPGGAASGAKGSHYERELVNLMRDAGWGCLRLPSSGSSTTRDLPDILAGRNLETDYGQAWAIEAKSGSDPTLYVDAEEVDALRRFADRWGCTPLLAARSTRQGTPTDHYLVRPANARETGGGNYGLPVADVADVADRAFAVVGSEGVRVE